jgi:AAA15 family ATPase/GTPase
MSEHFIKNIEIKNFKCFEDFKADGFGRVNLIGGKNNVGKTALIEAIYISNSKNNLKRIITTRYMADILWDLWKEIGKKFINNFIDEKIEDYKKSQIKTNLNDLKIDIKFQSSNKATKNRYENLYSLIIKNELEDRLDSYIKEFDSDIEKFRIINSQPYCKKNGDFYNLNEFGDGLSKFIYFIMLLLSQKNSIILIDEIENGIHYTNLDKLWEIILTISKQQNVQVFATTHSDECIRALVTANTENVKTYQPKEHILEDNEIQFIELGRVDGKVDSIIFDFKELKNEVAQNMEIRGW